MHQCSNAEMNLSKTRMRDKKKVYHARKPLLPVLRANQPVPGEWLEVSSRDPGLSVRVKIPDGSSLTAVLKFAEFCCGQL